MDDQGTAPTPNQGIEVAAKRHGVNPQALRDFVMTGELTGIPAAHQFSLIVALCEHVGIDPIERPFMILRETSWKMVDDRWQQTTREILYATRRCTSALCRTRKISREIVSSREVEIAGHAMIEVRARATMAGTGRYDEATGIVPIKTGKYNKQTKCKEWSLPAPDDAANLPMKAETKAKRRAVLDLVGLGLTDESELETMSGNVERVSPRQLSEAATEPKPAETDPFMTAKLAAKASAAMVRCARIAAAKSTDDKTVTPRAVWEAACAKFKLALLPDGSTPKIEQLRKSVAFPICDLIKTWESKLEPEVIEGDFTERQPGDDPDIDSEPDVNDAWNADTEPDPPGAP